MTRIAITTGASGGSSRRAATNYGTRDIEDVLPSKYAGAIGKESVAYTFSFDDLPTNGLDAAILQIPQYARIESATLQVITAFAGGTSYNLGLYEPDGTVVDADGIDAAVALAVIDAVGDIVICDGALVNGVVDVAEASQLVVAATGTFTAGKAKLEIVYTKLTDRA